MNSAAYLLLAFFYVVIGKLSLMLALPPGYVSPVFLPAGIAVAAAFIDGKRVLPWIFIGSLLLNIWVGYSANPQITYLSFFVATIIAIASMLQAAIGGWILRRVIAYPASLDNGVEVFRFLLLSPLICVTSATLSVSSLWMLNIVDEGSFISNWAAWWVGDTLGLIVMLPLVMVVAGEPRVLWRNRKLTVAVPILLIFALFVGIYLKANQWEYADSLADFRQLSQQANNRVQNKLEEQESLLEQSAGLFKHDVNANVSRDEFHRFVQKSLIRFSMIQALEWAPQVESNQRASFEAVQRRDWPGFEIRERDAAGQLQPAGDRVSFYPVTFVEPLAGNELAVGFDLASNQARLEAINRAKHSEHLVSSSAVTLVQESQQQSGILLLLAVNPDDPRSSVVLTVLRVNEFMEKLLHGLRPMIYTRLIDLDDQKNIFNNFEQENQRAYFQHNFDFGTRHYRLETAPTPAYFEQHHGWQSWSVLAGGMLGTGLLGALLLIGTGYTARIEKEVDDKTNKLKVSLELLNQAQSLAKIGTWQVVFGKDESGDIWTISKELRRLWGHSVDSEISTESGFARMPPEDSEVTQRLWASAKRGEGPTDWEHRILVNGEIRWMYVSSKFLFDTNGNAIEASGTNQDITERKQAEANLKNENEKIVTFLHNASDGIHILDANGNLIEASDSFFLMLGYQRDELIGKNVSLWDAQFPDVELERAIKNQFAAHKRSLFETQHRRKDGSVFEVEISGMPLVLEGMPALFNSSRDITARKQAEKRIAALMHEQTAMLETSLAGIAKVQNRIFTWVNPAMEKMFGYSKGGMNGLSTRVIYLSEQSYLNLGASAYPILGKGGVYRTQDQFRSKDGGSIWVDMNGIMLNEEDGISFWTFNDISDVKLAEQKMLQAQQSAEALARSKSEFLANMSHEIRTPMNAIIGLSSLALNKDMPGEIRDYLEKINSSSESLLGILNDILDFSKMEAGKLGIENSGFELGVMLDDLYNLFSARAQEKHLGFSIRVDPDIPNELVGDALRIQQILSNLLGNAIKFTAQGKVCVQVQLLERENSHARIHFSVSDSGIGISAEDQSILFQPFTQVDTSITRRFGGTGLGLAISHRLLQLMGGNFHIDSAAGMGATFSFELLLGVASGELIQKNERRHIERTAGTLSAELRKRGEGLRGCRILIAEDSRINQQVVKEFLKLSGVSVEVANNGKEALNLLEENSYDAILMDIHMPEMGGVEATEKIRQQIRYSTLPIIALTAGVTQEERERCKACGMNDFIAKPVNPEELIGVLCHWVGRKEAISVSGATPLPEEQTAQTKVTATGHTLQSLPGFDFTNVLSMVGGDEGVVKELLSGFREDMDAIEAEIAVQIEGHNFSAAGDLMHRIKGTAGNVGAMELHKVAAGMEVALKRNELDAANYDNFRAVLLKSKKAIDSLSS